MPKIREIREKQDEYRKNLQTRFMTDLEKELDKGLASYEKFRKIKLQVDTLRSERNKKTHEFAKTKDKQIIIRVRKIKEEIETKEVELRKLESEIARIELLLPNWTDSTVPLGKDDTKNKAVKYVGVPKVLPGNEQDFRKKFPGVKYKLADGLVHHADLTEKFGLAELERAAGISGARFYIEQGKLAMLDLAMSLFAFREFEKLGFEPIIPPEIMRRDVEERIAYFTAFEESIYELNEGKMILSPTAEHPVVASFSNTSFQHTELPFRLVAFSHAFRKEAGSHGKDTKGIFRTHQFSKVELHSITEPGDDRKELDFLVSCVEKVMSKLDIPYRIVINSSGDMDRRARIQMDLEGWFPAQNEFRELHSLATMGSWVSEKIGIKALKGSDKEMAANLYATGIAVQRTLLAMFVNNYEPEKQSIRIPQALREYCGFSKISLKTR